MNDIFENTETMKENEHPRFYTAESVMRGHPDKLCDLIADSVLDACLQHDPASRVACEVMATHGHIIVAGEITTSAKPDVFNIVRDTLRDVGYDPKAYQIDCYIHGQSPDIAGAVEPELAEGEDEDTLGAGDQGVMVGYACNETPEYLPMPVVAAQRLVTLLEISRMTGVIPDIGPDGKVQVTMEYNGDTPVRITTVVVSVQHKEDTDINKLADLLDEYVFPLAFDGMPADDAEIILNPSGKFVQGGPVRLSGREPGGRKHRDAQLQGLRRVRPQPGEYRRGCAVLIGLPGAVRSGAAGPALPWRHAGKDPARRGKVRCPRRHRAVRE